MFNLHNWAIIGDNDAVLRQKGRYENKLHISSRFYNINNSLLRCTSTVPDLV